MENLLGGTEETTTGVNRLHGLDKAGQLKLPMIAANDSYCKYLFDNRYGTGQSTWDGIMRTTNLVVAGKYVVVSGYGWCGKGVALRAKGLGAKVIVTEVDPIALEAVMDGYEALRGVREISPDVPVIALTAYAFETDRYRMFQAGFNECLAKPLRADELRTRIAALLSR